MAYTKEQWKTAREYFEAGLSLSKIEYKTGISKPQISKKSKAEGWQKETEKKHLVAQAVEVAVKKETLNETALDVHNELVNELTKHLIYAQNEMIKGLKVSSSGLDDISSEGTAKDKVFAGNMHTKTAKTVYDAFVPSVPKEDNTQKIEGIKIIDA